MGKPRLSAPRKIGCVQHDCTQCERLRRAAKALVDAAHRRGDTDPAYWEAVKAVEGELREWGHFARARKKPASRNKSAVNREGT